MAERRLTLAEVAEQFQFSTRWLRDFVRARDIPVLHTGKQIRFDGLALRLLEEALRRCPSKSSGEKGCWCQLHRGRPPDLSSD